jgi:hypothetical protein
MNRALQEKRTLIALAEKFGQTPSPKLIQEVAELQALEEQRLQRDADLRSRIATDISEFFNTVAAPTVTQVQDEPAVVLPTVLTETQADQTLKIQLPTSTVDVVKEYISNNIKESTVVNPDPVLAQPQRDLEREVKYLKEWVSRIAATGPGGGAGDIINLDAPVTLVTTSSYTISRRDYYVGVNVSTGTTVVLPGTNTKAGRSLIIKDESGRCSVNPITISGTIDNDTSGAILAIDNGALHLIYRQGWRIV